MLLGNEYSSELTSGKWEHHIISIEIEGADVGGDSGSSDEEGDSDLGSFLETSTMSRQQAVEINRRSRTATTPVSRNSKLPKRKTDSGGVLSGKLRVAPFPDATSAATRSSPRKPLKWRDMNLREIDTVFRFDVPQNRSIPFLLTPEELQLIKDDGSSSSNSNELQSMSSITAPPPAAVLLSSPHSLESPATPAATSPARAQAMQSVTSSIKQTVSNMTTTRRIVFTCGSIGLKWKVLSSGTWAFVAFRTTEECFRWTTLMRRVIVSQLRFETFTEEFKVLSIKPRPPPIDSPDIAALTDIFLSHDEHKMTKKSKDPRLPPGKGVLTLLRGGAPNKWAVFMDDKAQPHSTDRDDKQILHFLKIGKTLLDKPSNALLSFNVAKVLSPSQDINLRRTTIHVPKPFSNQFFLQQENRFGQVRRMEAQAESMENRIAWEEYLQTFGATKVLSDEEREAQNNVIGGDEDWDALLQAEADDGSDNLAKGKRMNNRTLSPFQWLTAKPQMGRSSSTAGARRSPSSESLMSPAAKSPSNFPSAGRQHRRTPSRVSMEASILSPNTRQESSSSKDFEALPPLGRSVVGHSRAAAAVSRSILKGSNSGSHYELPAVLMREREDTESLSAQAGDDSASSSIEKFSDSITSSAEGRKSKSEPLDIAGDPLDLHLRHIIVDHEGSESPVTPPLPLAPPPLDLMDLPAVLVSDDHLRVPQPASKEAWSESAVPAAEAPPATEQLAVAPGATTPRTPGQSELTASPMGEDLLAAVPASTLELSVNSGAGQHHHIAGSEPNAPSPRSPNSPVIESSMNRRVTSSPRPHRSPLPQAAEDATTAWVAQQQQSGGDVGAGRGVLGVSTPTTPGVLSNAPTNNHHLRQTSQSRGVEGSPPTLGDESRNFSASLGRLGNLQSSIALRNISSLSGELPNDSMTSPTFGLMVKSRSVFDDQGWELGKSLQEMKQQFRDSLQSFRGRPEGLADEADGFSDTTAPALLRRRGVGTVGGAASLVTPPDDLVIASSFPSGAVVEEKRRSSSMSSEDADLVTLNPALLGVYHKNSKASPSGAFRRKGTVCPLCGCDKVTTPTCTATGRKHAALSLSPSPRRMSAMSVTKGLADQSPLATRAVTSRLFSSPLHGPDPSPSRGSQQKFVRHQDESQEVVSARIFLDLD